jgi:hypothetical protein
MWRIISKVDRLVRLDICNVSIVINFVELITGQVNIKHRGN